jgi:hypothetical protein
LNVQAFRIAHAPGLSYKSTVMWQIFKEFLLFLRQEKKWWLLPLIVILLALGLLLVFSTTSPLAPLLYPLF